jgi:hypothetical protein
MTYKKSNPVAYGGGARENVRDWRLNSPENKPSAPSLQAMRVAHLARRHRLAPALARAVADLAFSEVMR